MNGTPLPPKEYWSNKGEDIKKIKIALYIIVWMNSVGIKIIVIMKILIVLIANGVMSVK